MRKVCILGSTGSVGENTLEVIRQHPSLFKVVGLACGQSIEKLKLQIQEFSPDFVSVGSSQVADELRKVLNSQKIEIFVGPEGHRQLVKESKADIVMASMSGTHGLFATLQAIEQSVDILGIANKEVLVMAGDFINAALKKSSTRLLPVDSEHSAIFQCLLGNRREDLKKIILTASGGPFRTWPVSDFDRIRPADALKHPNWVMGSKITIDSATMMNKGLEYIEAIQLFQLKPEEIEILVHPQSIIHSMVEYKDASVIAQLGLSDMKIPISFALAFPGRLNLELPQNLDFTKLGRLDFEAPDFDKFPCMKLAIEAAKANQATRIALNAANEIAVEAFLRENLSFSDISRLIESAMLKFEAIDPQNLEEAIKLDLEVKNWSSLQINGELKRSACS